MGFVVGADRPYHAESENSIDVLEPGFLVLVFGVASRVADEILKVVANVSYNLNRIAKHLLLVSEWLKTSKTFLK